MDGLIGEGLGCVRGGRRIFDGVDFAVAPAGALLVTGPNGAGKSTLLRLLAGLLRPAAGRLCWDGEDVSADAAAHRRRLVYVGHLDALKPALTAAEHLQFWARLAGLSIMGARPALSRFGMEDLADVPARLLSAGQRRRVDLARLALGEAKLWLLDEPTVGLDQDAMTALETAIAAHRAGGGIVVAATHVDMIADGAARLALRRSAPEMRDEVW